MTTRRTYTADDWQADQARAKDARKGRRILAAAPLRQNTLAAMARHLKAQKRAKKEGRP